MAIIPTNLILFILVYPIRLIFVKWCQGDGVVDNFVNTGMVSLFIPLVRQKSETGEPSPCLTRYL